MAQFNTFYIPMDDDGMMAERLNLFLRAHRVLSVRQRDFSEGWGFCVEWIDGTNGGGATRWDNAPYRDEYQCPRGAGRLAMRRVRTRALPSNATRGFYLLQAWPRLSRLTIRLVRITPRMLHAVSVAS